MERKIYDSKKDKPQEIFLDMFSFMKHVNGAERVTYASYGNGLNCEYYHIQPEGATLRWISKRDEKTHEWFTEISVFGSENGIVEVEKRILDGLSKLLSTKDSIKKLQQDLEGISV